MGRYTRPTVLLSFSLNDVNNMIIEIRHETQY